MRRLIITCLSVFMVTAIGCTNNTSDKYSFPDDTDTSSGLGQGEDCSEGQICAEGLVCAGDGTCQPEGAPGTSGEGDDCGASFQCLWGLVCASDGTCQQPGADGTGEAGENCGDDEDCMLFLECIDGVCAGFQPPYWTGATCEDPSTYPDDFKVFFEVDGSSPEFYRLPFPNDIRFRNGHVDLSGHANPGLLIPEFGNPVDDYFDMIENDLDGFGANSCVFFRFSKWINGATLDNMSNLYIVNIDPSSDEYGEKAWSGYKGNNQRKLYICSNWLALCPSMGRPLLPSTTYAAILTSSIKDESGNNLGQDADFTTMLGSSEPSDSNMAAAWQDYTPLRDYISEQAMDGSSIAGAAVFTTESLFPIIQIVRDAVRYEAMPAASALVTDTSQSAFTTYTGTVTVPFYQAGTRPFATADQGGAIEYHPFGYPLLVEEEDVKFALTVPVGTPPVNGWPIVLYAHGTGGSEMSFVDNGVAGWMAQAGAAVMGLEQVQHGDRRKLSSSEAALEVNSPERLFYNFINPYAARDNNVQSAADYFQLVRFVENFDTVTGEAILFDTDNIYFYGHSQGTQGPFIFAAHEPMVKGMILSGAGGCLIESFLNKENPVNVASAIRLVLMDPDLDKAHPLLNLIQLAMDVVDPVSHAPAVFRDTWAPDTYPHRHVFMSHGIGDTFTPEKTILALTKTLLLKQWSVPGYAFDTNVVEEIDSLPHSGTYYAGGDHVTAVLVQYEPGSSYDGHFVMTNHPDAIAQQIGFVETMIADGTPTLIDP